MADRRAIDENIKTTERRDGLAHGARDRIRVCAIGLYGDRATSDTMYSLSDLVSLFGGVLVGERDVRAAFGQRQRDRGSDASRSSRNQRTFSIQIDHIFVLFYHFDAAGGASPYDARREQCAAQSQLVMLCESYRRPSRPPRASARLASAIWFGASSSLRISLSLR